MYDPLRFLLREVDSFVRVGRLVVGVGVKVHVVNKLPFQDLSSVILVLIIGFPGLWCTEGSANDVRVVVSSLKSSPLIPVL